MPDSTDLKVAMHHSVDLALAIAYAKTAAKVAYLNLVLSDGLKSIIETGEGEEELIRVMEWHWLKNDTDVLDIVNMRSISKELCLNPSVINNCLNVILRANLKEDLIERIKRLIAIAKETDRAAFQTQLEAYISWKEFAFT